MGNNGCRGRRNRDQEENGNTGWQGLQCTATNCTKANWIRKFSEKNLVRGRVVVAFKYSMWKILGEKQNLLLLLIAQNCDMAKDIPIESEAVTNCHPHPWSNEAWASNPPPMTILWTLNWTPPPSFFTGPPHAVTPRWIDSNVLNALNTSLWGSLPPPCRPFCHNILQQFSATLKHNWLLSQFYATSTPTAWAEELLGSGEDLQKCSLICRNSNNWIMVIL